LKFGRKTGPQSGGFSKIAEKRGAGSLVFADARDLVSGRPSFRDTPTPTGSAAKYIEAASAQCAESPLRVTKCRRKIANAIDFRIIYAWQD